MIDIRNPAILALGAAVAALLLLLAGQNAQLQGERAAHAETKGAHAQQLQRIAEKTATAATAAAIAQQAHQRAVAALDSQRTQELAHALADNDRRRAADLAGPGRLRIPATCPARPAGGGDLPSAASAAGVDAAAAEVPAAFRQELWDLRAAMITERAQLLALQDYVGRIVSGHP